MPDILVYEDQRYGAAQVFTLPADKDAQPQTAYIPGGPFALATAHLAARGTDVSWSDWAQRLAGQQPYYASWYVEDVPGGLSPAQALFLTRKRAAARALGLEHP